MKCALLECLRCSVFRVDGFGFFFTCHVCIVLYCAIKDAGVGPQWLAKKLRGANNARQCPTPWPGVVHAAACMCACGMRIYARHVSKGRERRPTYHAYRVAALPR